MYRHIVCSCAGGSGAPPFTLTVFNMIVSDLVGVEEVYLGSCVFKPTLWVLVVKLGSCC